MKTICEGAEAQILLDNDLIIKVRKNKRYRDPLLDKKIILNRTRNEYNICKKVNKIIHSPEIKYVDINNGIIKMNFINYPKIKNVIIKHNNIILNVAQTIAKLHNNNIIHGDITLSNMLYDEKSNSVYLIDFGLSFHSNKIEDFATDIFVFKETILAEFSHDLWQKFITEYKKHTQKDITKKLQDIEMRRKYN